ncbi:GntR family transcriptional regulator, partial [Klebsiella pneumoniae]|uniref:GntR family transcriptional regulator n=1 Tax=Klebsiella pneumoniae TaxID=573 RepID=UPI0013D518DB
MPLLAQKIRPLDGAGRGPLYRQLETALREVLRDNLLKPNEALPAERDLAADLSVSRITLRKAIDKLVD